MVAGVVVLYNSSASVLERIRTYLPQLGRLYVVDNSEPIDELITAQLRALPDVRYLPNGGNKGVASALNRAARQAIEDGFSYLLTMDDDSQAPENLIEALLEVYQTYPNEKIGIVSAWHHDKPAPRGLLRRVLFTMTSGNLLNLSAFSAVGPFLDELFIDHVDHEYGLRLNSFGYMVVERTDVRLTHALGVRKTVPFGPFHQVRFISHQPIRTYYFARNGLYVVKKYWYRYPSFLFTLTRLLLKESVKTVLLENNRTDRIRFFRHALKDVRQNKLGKFTPDQLIPRISYPVLPVAPEREAAVLSQIWIVIVLYKTSLEDSQSYQSLKIAARLAAPGERVSLMICDNSPTPQLDVDQLSDEHPFNLYYLHDPSNPGVSRSYNRGAELAAAHGKKWLLVLDQDTLLPPNILQQYRQAVLAYPDFPVYVPKLYDSSLLLSPCRYVLWKGSHLREVKPGIHHMAYRNVLNSGLLIDIEALQKANGYDEDVWLYFSDFVFFDRLKKHYRDFIVVDTRLQHQLSSSDYSNREFALTRFSYYCQGARVAGSKSLTAYMMYGVTVGLRSLLMGYRLKSVKFVNAFVRDFLGFQPSS